ncbi:MAG: phosphate transport system substrate-binding protein, partial [Gaiellales bacterium]|nr:phosphate transport system substrate-binding protein [Gaiellales bacterium]
LNSDLTQNLLGVYNAPEANAYPLASYSYLITHTTGFDRAKGAVLGKWIIYIACAGQQEAAPLGYSPLSPNLVKVVFDAVRRIPGAPTPPPLTASACPNPTITGKGYGGGPQDGGQGVSGGGGGGGGTQTGGSGGGTTTPTGGTKKPVTKTIDPALAAASGSTTGFSVTSLSDGQRRAAYASALHLVASISLPSGSPAEKAAILVALVALAPLALLAPLSVLVRPARRRREDEDA